MKVIKRNGRAVEYNKEKIITAIQKANNEVPQKEKATNNEIKKIINYIEDLGKKRILVEDIQDIIEEKLMAFKKYELAKKYIVYRYTRTLVRKQNTTDETILGLIRNENRDVMEEDGPNTNTFLASSQRDYIAGEVSKDLTNRILLPEKISKAHDDGVLYFHNSEYFIQPIFNCCLVDIENMLENGTVINGKLIESPKSFLVAATLITQIIAAIASNQYGGQSVDIRHLGKFLRKSKESFKEELLKKYDNKVSREIIDEIVNDKTEKEIVSGVQTIICQINTLMTTNGKPPAVTIFLKLDENDEFIEENIRIIEQIFKQSLEGIKNENGEFITPEFPKFEYVIDENNCLNGGKYDYLTELAVKCSVKKVSINYISAKKMEEKYKSKIFPSIGNNELLSLWKDENKEYKFDGRFNQGRVTINLPQIGIISNQDEKKFWELLDERLELCHEALMCRHYALLNTKADVSPIHWRYGAISRLESGKNINEFLKNSYSTITLRLSRYFRTYKNNDK